MYKKNLSRNSYGPSALRFVQAAGRIVNRVRTPDGTAAVCAETEARCRKSVIGKLRRQSPAAGRDIFRKRESEDLLGSEITPACELWARGLFVVGKRPRQSLCDCRGFFLKGGERVGTEDRICFDAGHAAGEKTAGAAADHRLRRAAGHHQRIQTGACGGDQKVSPALISRHNGIRHVN